MQAIDPSDVFSDAWGLIRALSRRHSCADGSRFRVMSPALGGAASDGRAPDSADVVLGNGPRGWTIHGSLPEADRQLLDLHLPICRALSAPDASAQPYTLAHLGQSLDGFVAGADGLSDGLNGPENIVHLHRLRALFDAVLVGRQTVTADDPRLTTRLVPGPHPARVVLDPLLCSEPALRLYADPTAPTLLICAADAPNRAYPAHTRVLRLECCRADLDAKAVLARLRVDGFASVFIEGGGSTVSRMLAAGVLHRLQIAVAPVFIGSGVRGIALPAIERFRSAIRPACAHFTMGRDVLFDFELAAR